jgi:GntR family transcriptional regulator/MocR family aminotransferase
MDLVIPLSRRSGEPLFRQIYVGLRRGVLSGALRSGERLPSTRELADQLRVSRTVVLLAYDQLLAEGFVTGLHGSGTYVSAGLNLGNRAWEDRERSPAPKLRLSRFGRNAAESASTVSLPSSDGLQCRYDFVYGGSNVGHFPFAAWRRILLRNARKAPVRDLHYGSAAGNVGLREAIARHVRRSRAVVCDASQVIVVSGSQQALDLVVRVLLEPGEEAAIEDPHYQGTRHVLRTAGVQIHSIRVDRDGVMTHRLPDSAQVAFVTPSHQFPTGVVLTLPRRLELLAWAKRRNAIVVEDDYDGEFRYDGQPLESLQGLDHEGRVIYIGTFSRTIFPSLRIGYLIAPRPLVPAFEAAKWLCDRHTATLEQQTLAEFITNGMYERYLHRVRRSNALRREALLEAIGRFIGDRAELTGEAAGAHVVLWPKRRISEHALVDEARARGVGVYGVGPYHAMRSARAGLILGYSRMTEADICEGVRRLGGMI